MKANRNAAYVSQMDVVKYSQGGYQHAWQSDAERAPRSPWGRIAAAVIVVLVVIIVVALVV